MGVRGRDAMREARDALCASTRQATDLPHASHSTDETTSSGRGIATQEDNIKAERKKSEQEDHVSQMLLKELYQTLIAGVEAALEGAEELLIVPHKELFEVPWASLTDADGRYLIERYVIRTAPSLRVARQFAEKMHEQGEQEEAGHALVVGNPCNKSEGQ
jgi:CHAT domain-containing protein